jgi:type II secretory pathway predicted ATPase ExeA
VIHLHSLLRTKVFSSRVRRRDTLSRFGTKTAAIIDAPLEHDRKTRSFADDPQFIASLPAIEQGLATERTPAQTETLESLSEAMWSEVAAQWDALAPLNLSHATRIRNRVPPPVRVDTPFAAAPDLRFLYHSAEHDRALSELLSSITRGESVVVLTGARGAGKTTLCRALVEHLGRRTLVSFVSAAPSVDDLLKRLLVDFGVISNDETARQLDSASRDDLSRALGDFLSSLTILRASALVIVDDAHTLSPEVWNELGAICQKASDLYLLQMLLVGESGLKQLMRTSDARAIERRVAFRVELGSLQRQEIHAYVPHRLAVAGRADDVRFDDGALRSVFARSGGMPGDINAICDRALTLAGQTSANRIDAALAAQAANEVGFTSTAFRSNWRDRAVVAALLIAMLVAGAASAGWVFRSPLSRALAHWRVSNSR